MASIKQPLMERSTNIPSPLKSPSKIPLPPSPEKRVNVLATPFAEETGPMSDTFKASTLSQKPDFVKQIAAAHSIGQTYNSPSDEISSPTTKKLSEVKGRRMGNLKKSLYNSSNIFAKARGNENAQDPMKRS